MRKNITLLILFASMAACSHLSDHGIVGPNLSLNTGEPPAKIIKVMYMDTYEFAQDETSKKFVLSNTPPNVKPIEKAIRINLSASANHIQVEPIKENNAGSIKTKEMVSYSNSKPSAIVTSSLDILTVYFELDSFAISQPEALKLQNFIAGLKTDGIRQVDITGYTDSIGSSEVNNVLALKRAEAVADVFSKAGFTVTAHGKGKCCYIDPQNQQLNRRVEISSEQSRMRKEVVKSN